MLYPVWFTHTYHGYYIEPVFKVNPVLENICLCSRHEKPYLPVIDSLFGIAVQLAAAALDLNKNQRIAFFCNYINLLMTRTPVIMKYCKPLVHQIPRSKHLAFSAKKIMFCHNICKQLIIYSEDNT